MSRLSSFAQNMGLFAIFFVFAGAVFPQAAEPQPSTPSTGGSTGGASVPSTGGSTGGSTSAPSPGRTTIPTQPPTTTQQERTTFPSEMARPIFLSGKVVLDDGTPAESVVIERVCNGIARPEAYTDSRGHFSFQLGANNHVFPDASVTSASESGMGGFGSTRTGPFGGSREFTERELMNCEIRASLAGFRSDSIPLSGRRFLDNPDLGTIVMRRMGNVEGFTISATTAMAPKDARKAFDKGRDAVRRKKLPEAAKEFEKAVQLYPKFAVAWYNLGMVREQQKDIAGARKAYAESLAADAKFVNPYMQLAQIAAQEGNWQEAADTSARLVRLNPYDFPVGYFINAVANYNLKRFDEAEESARNAIKNDPKNRIPKLHHLLGTILALKQDYAQAATHIRNYLQFAPNAPDSEQVKKQLAEIEKAAQPDQAP